MKKILSLIAAITLFSFSMAASKTAVYSIPLTRVENTVGGQADGEKIQILADDEKGLSRSQYEDETIQIIWKCDGKRFWFNMLNKTDYPITIDWDKIVFVGIDDEIGNVIHSGIKYVARNDGQLKTILPKRAKITDFLVPSKNCVYRKTGYFSGGWEEDFLFPCVYKNQKSLNLDAANFIGKTMRIEMPMQIGDREGGYSFYFELKDVLNTSTKSDKRNKKHASEFDGIYD